MESGKKSSKEIQPDIDRPEIVWSTLDDKGFEIPYGVHPDETSTGLSRVEGLTEENEAENMRRQFA